MAPKHAIILMNRLFFSHQLNTSDQHCNKIIIIIYNQQSKQNIPTPAMTLTIYFIGVDYVFKVLFF